MEERDDDTTLYKVMVNHEAQYSMWPAYRELPLGWREVGHSGRKQESLALPLARWRLVTAPTPIPVGNENFATKPPQALTSA